VLLVDINTGAAEIIGLNKYLNKSLTEMKIHYFGGLRENTFIHSYMK